MDKWNIFIFAMGLFCLVEISSSIAIAVNPSIAELHPEVVNGCHEIKTGIFTEQIISLNPPINVEELSKRDGVHVNIWCGNLTKDNTTEWIGYGRCDNILGYRVMHMNANDPPITICYE